MKIKILYWLSGIIGIIFIIFFIILASLKKVNLGIGIAAIIIVLLLVGVGDTIVWFINSRRGVKEEKKSKLASLEDLRAISIKALIEDYYEYEKDLLWEDIIEMGDKHTPIYIKLVRGEFENRLYGIVINVADVINRKGIAEYDDKRMSMEEIKIDILKRANLAAYSPKEERPMREMRSFDPISGREVTQREHLPDFTKPAEEGTSLQ